MQPMPKVFNVVEDFGDGGFREKAIVRRYEDCTVRETKVEKPAAVHSAVSRLLDALEIHSMT